MTSSKNGTRRLILIFATLIILPMFGWVFNEIVWGGIQENKSKGKEISAQCAARDTANEAAHDSIRRDHAEQYNELYWGQQAIILKQTQAEERRMFMDSSILYKLEKIGNKIGF